MRSAAAAQRERREHGERHRPPRRDFRAAAAGLTRPPPRRRAADRRRRKPLRWRHRVRPPAPRRRTGCGRGSETVSPPGRLDRRQVDARLGVDNLPLHMQARLVDRVTCAHMAVDDVDDDLEDRRADAVRARAADDQLDVAALAEDDRGGHHRGHPAAWRIAEEAERIEVLLPHDVVEVDARAGHDDPRARAVRAGDRAGAPVRVEDRDVGRRAELCAEKRSRNPGSSSPASNSGVRSA